MSKLENNSITPNIANQIINDLPHDLFIDPSKKFCYASIVDDYIISKIYDKLYDGLKDVIIDENERRHHILDNMIYGISLSNAKTRLVKKCSMIKNIYTKNILEDDLSDMPKFDFIIQNPPYNKSLHLDFFNKGLDLLSDIGKMIIIEPSTWLIDLRQNIADKKSSQMKKYIAIKERIKGHVSKVVIENFNKEFNVTNTVPFSITYIDNAKTFNKIEFINCGVKKYVNSLYDCNLIGNIEIIKSIFKRIKNYDIVNNHIINKQLNDNKIHYILYNGILRPLASSYFIRENYFCGNTCYYKHYFGNYYMSFISPTLNISRNNISNKIHKAAARGGSVKGKLKLTDNDASCIYGTKQELENYKYFISNNSIPLFINICLTIDQHNNSLPYVPWLVDKQYTDEEIYDMFGFNEDEIKLIETTIKKYERYSPWFKRYMCGPSSVSDEEVQKFINELENEKN